MEFSFFKFISHFIISTAKNDYLLIIQDKSTINNASKFLLVKIKR